MFPRFLGLLLVFAFNALVLVMAGFADDIVDHPWFLEQRITEGMQDAEPLPAFVAMQDARLVQVKVAHVPGDLLRPFGFLWFKHVFHVAGASTWEHVSMTGA